MWGTLVHFENPVVISSCGVGVLKCLEVLGPGKKILETMLRSYEVVLFLMNKDLVISSKCTSMPGSKDERMCLDELSLAVERDVGIVSVVAQLSHLGHELGQVVKAHAICIPDF